MATESPTFISQIDFDGFYSKGLLDTHHLPTSANLVRVEGLILHLDRLNPFGYGLYKLVESIANTPNGFKDALEDALGVAKAQAAALGAQRQTPDIVMGSSGSTSSTQQVMDVLAAKAARDLNVNPKP